MTVGPIVGGIGLLMFMRVGANPDYLTEVLPAVVVFGLGISAMVAPLTATVLDSVDERHMGIASGINNGISRVAGLLSIAILGAVIAGQFSSAIDDGIRGVDLSPAAESVVGDAQAKPLAVPATGELDPGEATTVTGAVSAASESSFHLGMSLAGVLMICGGVIAGVGIRNPKRGKPHEESAPRAATAGECGRCGGDPAGAGFPEAEDVPSPPRPRCSSRR